MVVFVVGSDYWSLRMLQAVLRTGCMDMIFRSHYTCQSLATLSTFLIKWADKEIEAQRFVSLPVGW